MCSRARRSWVAICAALLASCGPPDGPLELVPTIEGIEPAVGYAQVETPVVVRGSFPVKAEASYSDATSNLVDTRYRAWIGDVELLDVTRLDASTASAVVPAGIAPGSYALSLESPFRTRATRPAAFTVMPGKGPLLHGTASVSPPRISVGQPATLTLVVENSGSADVRALAPSLEIVAGASSLGEPSPDPAAKDVSAGGTVSFTWTFTGAASGEVALAIDGSGTDATNGNTQAMPRATASVTVQTAPALVTTASIAPATVTVGQQITVTAVVRNDGLATATSVAAEVSSSFAGLGSPVTSPGVQDIAGGASATFTWTHHPTAPTPANGITLSVAAAGLDANSGARVAAAPATTNVLLVNPPAQVGANLEAPAVVTAGQQIAVTLTVTNAGAAPADVTPILDDPAVAGTATVTPASGSTLPTARVAASSAQIFRWVFGSSGSGAITFSARAAWRDVNSGDVGTASTAPVTVQVLRPASLAISTATATPAAVAAGQTVTVTAVVANGGESTVVGAAATISAAPAGFTLAGAPPPPQDVPGGGLTRTFTWTYSVAAPASGGTFTIEVAGTDANTQQPVAAAPATTNAVAVGYPLGGTVAGLAGTGLVLRNGGESLPIAAGASGFAFPTPVASGSTYDVTVEAQPTAPSQVCIVSGGTGTVGTGPVTTVAVSCTTRAFGLGGTVAGLEGTGLVLRNGSDVLPVAPGATTFTFPTPLASGTAYDVTIEAQPTAPTQTCAVTNGSGTIAAANVTDVRVTCTTGTFSLGGTVTGLEGRGLRLRNGSETVRVDAPATSFTFPTPLASGSTYDVSVDAQPSHPAQVCSVTNGSGTVGGADVTDVVVTCSTRSFTLGGTVSGLAGTGLVLTSGGDSLPVSTNGAFTFPTPVADGTGYAVTVVSHPAEPTQTCPVTNGSGTVDGADVTSVSVACSTSTFTVGGTVSGLLGSGLALRNGGELLSVLAGATGFTFVAPVASGATYDVSVEAQPAGPTQVCVVTNGSGAVADANVTGVVVTCATTEFSIGGTITGLVGAGLVLRNGGETLAVDPLATTFTFPTRVPSGGGYLVTVEVQPSVPGQRCVVANGEGTVGSGPVSSVAVTCELDPPPP